jgi:hypothetical protein
VFGFVPVHSNNVDDREAGMGEFVGGYPSKLASDEHYDEDGHKLDGPLLAQTNADYVVAPSAHLALFAVGMIVVADMKLAAAVECDFGGIVGGHWYWPYCPPLNDDIEAIPYVAFVAVEHMLNNVVVDAFLGHIVPEIDSELGQHGLEQQLQHWLLMNDANVKALIVAAAGR